MKMSTWKIVNNGFFIIAQKNFPKHCKLVLEGESGIIEEMYLPISRYLSEEGKGFIKFDKEITLETVPVELKPVCLKIYMKSKCVLVCNVLYDWSTNCYNYLDATFILDNVLIEFKGVDNYVIEKEKLRSTMRDKLKFKLQKFYS